MTLGQGSGNEPPVSTSECRTEITTIHEERPRFSNSAAGSKATVPGGDLRLFQQLLDIIPAGAYTCDAAGLITYFNRRAVEVWGREPELGQPVDRY